MFIPPLEEENSAVPAKKALVWSDEFDSGSVPDPAKWAYDIGRGSNNDGWGNDEAQSYTNVASNSFVNGGTLKIQAVKTGSAWTSARLVTRGKQDWTYGTIEIKARLPVAKGTWSAIWMLPKDSFYGTNYWPDNGEIDIMEHSQVTKMYEPFGTVHRNAGFGSDGAGAGSKKISDINTAFHTYSIEWSADEIKWFYDDEYLGNYKKNGGTGWQWWPFDKPFHLILNLAMGGTLGGAIDPSVTEATMEIEYVRVYK